MVSSPLCALWSAMQLYYWNLHLEAEILSGLKKMKSLITSTAGEWYPDGEK